MLIGAEPLKWIAWPSMHAVTWQICQ